MPRAAGAGSIPKCWHALRLGAYQLLYLNARARVGRRPRRRGAGAIGAEASAAGMTNAVLRRLANGDRRALPRAALPTPATAIDRGSTYLSSCTRTRVARCALAGAGPVDIIEQQAGVQQREPARRPCAPIWSGRPRRCGDVACGRWRRDLAVPARASSDSS